MEKSTFFIWLNLPSHSRHYWIGGHVQNWTTDFQAATKFDTAQAADDEAEYAARTTKAEVVVQEMLVPA